jgi:hypothetical protein
VPFLLRLRTDSWAQGARGVGEPLITPTRKNFPNTMNENDRVVGGETLVATHGSMKLERSEAGVSVKSA